MLDSPVQITAPSPNYRTALSAWPTVARNWIQLFAPGTNGGTVFVGGLTIGSGQGIPLYPGGSMFLPGVIHPDLVGLFFITGGDVINWVSHQAGP